MSEDGGFTIIQALGQTGCIIATGKNGELDRGV